MKMAMLQCMNLAKKILRKTARKLKYCLSVIFKELKDEQRSIKINTSKKK